MRFFRFQPLLGQQRQHQILLFFKTKNHISFSRILLTWEALIHSIPISEVQDMKVMFCKHLEKFQGKKNFEVSS